ncbi:PLP-dependent transferase [Gonapodya prolifera JEL478]|uniref:PLP-dependent transferase n=1 Tax=Gonapodya prolifera (strain JEL478) TaxID=1344416 RepID=A0A139AWW7_GONPJ|nr:PLP-dependent transferase [Gonapodya prolifera JEL478]|eukprot:KXS21197.1 PLP-dependent transferase [Gonapodya prolifera JEL478]
MLLPRLPHLSNSSHRAIAKSSLSARDRLAPHSAKNLPAFAILPRIVQSSLPFATMPTPSSSANGTAPAPAKPKTSEKGAAKLAKFQPEGTVFSEFTGMCMKYNAVNLGQGFPTIGVPQFIRDFASQTMLQDTLVQQYARSEGNPKLVNALAQFYKDSLKREVDPLTEILTTVGATEAIFSAIQAFISPGDAVILISPHYDSYPASVHLAGGRSLFVNIKPPADRDAETSDDWKVDFEEIERLCAQEQGRVKMILLNNPNNPVGKVWTLAELQRVADIATKYDLVVLADEVYETLVYDDAPNPMIKFATLPGMWERTLTVGSVGKTMGVTGWKIGWIVAPPEMIRTVWLVHQWVPFAIVNPLQEATALSFEHAIKTGFFEEQRKQYQELRDHLMNILTESKLSPCKPHGGYFIMSDVSHLPDPLSVPELSSSPLYADETRRDYRMCRWLVAEVGVGGIPPSPFYDSEDVKGNEIAGRYLRFAFCKSREMLDAAAQRLAALKGL